MNTAPQILALAGSTRTASWNKMLVRLAAEGAREAGARVDVIDLRDYPLALYDADLEEREGIPEAARHLKALCAASSGFLIASPEYNSSISGVLKNTIDWMSRPAPGEPPLLAFRGKAAALMAASPGGLGGYRGLTQLRWILGNLGVLVLPDMVTVPLAQEAFSAEGRLTDPRKQAAITALGHNLATLAGKL